MHFYPFEEKGCDLQDPHSCVPDLKESYLNKLDAGTITIDLCNALDITHHHILRLMLQRNANSGNFAGKI